MVHEPALRPRARSIEGVLIEAKLDIFEDGRVHRFSITREAKPLSYADVLKRWESDSAFVTFFISILFEAPFSAFRWETPPVTRETLGATFEFVILDSPWLDLPPDPAPFEPYFTDKNSEAEIVVFENLGKDAVLVVPYPRAPASAYGHLAAFTRRASATQNHALWREVARTMQQRVSDRPVWLSTAGGGVAWLHVRLDSRPKYYHYSPYGTLR